MIKKPQMCSELKKNNIFSEREMPRLLGKAILLRWLSCKRN